MKFQNDIVSLEVDCLFVVYSYAYKKPNVIRKMFTSLETLNEYIAINLPNAPQITQERADGLEKGPLSFYIALGKDMTGDTLFLFKMNIAPGCTIE